MPMPGGRLTRIFYLASAAAFIAATGAESTRDNNGTNVELSHLIKSLDLQAHVQTFTAQEVLSGADLSRLSKEDMSELGLTIGARNRVLAWQRRQQQPRRPGDDTTLRTDHAEFAGPYNDSFDVRRYGADPNGNCCAERPIQAAINDSGHNDIGDYSCGQGCATWGP